MSHQHIAGKLSTPVWSGKVRTTNVFDALWSIKRHSCLFFITRKTTMVIINIEGHLPIIIPQEMLANPSSLSPELTPDIKWEPTLSEIGLHLVTLPLSTPASIQRNAATQVVYLVCDGYCLTCLSFAQCFSLFSSTCVDDVFNKQLLTYDLRKFGF